MRKTTMVPFIFVIFGVILGVSSDRNAAGSPGSRSLDFMEHERAYDRKSHERLLEAYGREKSSMDSSFGNDAVIERQQSPQISKTSQRRYAALPQNHPVREPSIQAYGLPKRTFDNNGEIERVDLDRTSSLDEKVDKVLKKNPGIQAYGLPKRIAENNGVIERLGMDHDEAGSSFASTSSSGTGASNRRTRSIDRFVRNDLVDLEAQEAKVFRPLFVYRQQVADRYRIKPRRNPIYGSHQYGADRQRNSMGSRKYY